MPQRDLDPQTAAGGQDHSGVSRLRLLDFDDLFLLSHLLDGNTIAATARQLGLTQPAITQRVRKIERVFGQAMLQKAGRHVRLTRDGRAICVKARDALSLMRDVAEATASESLTVGTEPLFHDTWLWPALAALRQSHPDSLLNALVGGADEVAALLDAGTLTAVLTSRAAGGKLAGIELGDEDFMVVARPELAAQISGIEDLEQQVLLEVDRSFGLLSRVASTTRAKMKFKDVWFVGGASQVLAAAKAGHGLAILPEHMVTPALQTGQLAVVLPSLDIPSVPIRLLYRSERVSEALIKILAKTLTKQRSRP